MSMKNANAYDDTKNSIKLKTEEKLIFKETKFVLCSMLSQSAFNHRSHAAAAQNWELKHECIVQISDRNSLMC